LFNEIEYLIQVIIGKTSKLHKLNEVMVIFVFG